MIERFRIPPPPTRRWRAAGVGLAAIAMLVLSAAAAAAPLTTTSDADTLRTGWYPEATAPTPGLLEEGGFGRLFDTPVQGQVYAQPLMNEGTLLVATEDNWIYGIDPGDGSVRWSRNVGAPWESSDCPSLAPRVGITGTPVIDPAAGVAYFLSKSSVSGNAVWQMHAVDLSDGSEEQGFPVEISGEAENLPGVVFKPGQELQRPALLLMDGVVYAAFGSLCDKLPYEGWIIGVSTSGQVTTRWAAAASGAAIWQSGGGLISDASGEILFTTGNGAPPEAGPGSSPPEGSLGESVIRAAVQPDGALLPTDFFSPYDNAFLDEQDLDLGSGAPIALPSPYFGTESDPHLMVQTGKQGVAYLLDRDSLGGMGQGAEEKDDVLDVTPGPHAAFGSPAVWPGEGGYVYVPTSAALEAFGYGVDGSGAPRLSLAATSETFAYGSGSPIVTSDGTTSGSAIVWIPRCPARPCTAATLNAYPAVPKEGAFRALFRGELGSMAQFARPLAANGRIYVGTKDGHLLAFGRLGSGQSPPEIPPPPTAAGPALPTVSTEPPRTRLTQTVITRRKRRATFRFDAVGAATGFQCKLTRPRSARRTRGPARFSGCRSPRSYKRLTPGRYTFKLRAVGPGGPDPTPAERNFRVGRKKGASGSGGWHAHGIA